MLMNKMFLSLSFTIFTLFFLEFFLLYFGTGRRANCDARRQQRKSLLKCLLTSTNFIFSLARICFLTSTIFVNSFELVREKASQQAEVCTFLLQMMLLMSMQIAEEGERQTWNAIISHLHHNVWSSGNVKCHSRGFSRNQMIYVEL